MYMLYLWLFFPVTGVSGFLSLSKNRCQQLGTARFASPYLSAEYLYFDITVQDQDIGRMVFQLSIPSNLPKHAEHVIEVCRGDRRSIDPRASYKNCQFDYSLDYIEGPQYRWSHILKGPPSKKILEDPESQLQTTHKVFGGQYYGDEYMDGTVLCVPIVGPGRGTSRLTIVRVQESPREWKERLLLNSGVIGKLVEGQDVLEFMAKQKYGPPMVRDCGVLEEGDVDA